MQKRENNDFIKKAEIGLRRGVARALYEHKRNNRSIVIWRDGNIVTIPPEDIEVPDWFNPNE